MYVPRTDNVRQVAFVPARQSCENLGIAAAVQSVLATQKVDLPQSTLVMKLSGTDTCGPFLGGPAEAAKAVSGDYTLDNGRRIHVEALFEDTFVDPGRLIRAISEDRPFLLFWKHHAFMVIGLKYVEGIHSSGLHIYDIREMRLMDPFGSAEQSPTVFEKRQESLREVSGIVEVTATSP